MKQVLIMTTDWNHLGADCPPILTCQTFNQILDNNSNTASSRPYLPGELEVGRRAWCPPTWASMVWGRSIKTMVMEVRRWARGKCQVGLLILSGGFLITRLGFLRNLICRFSSFFKSCIFTFSTNLRKICFLFIHMAPRTFKVMVFKWSLISNWAARVQFFSSKATL